MAAEVRVPRMGQSVSDVVLVAWCAQPGSAVRAGDVVARVESDKSDIDVEAPVDGVLGPHQADEGDSCPVGAVLVRIVTAGEADGPTAPGISPKARRRAGELGVDTSALRGSGPDGLVTVADVEVAVATAGDGSTWQGRRVASRRTLSTVERATARRLAESWRTAPHFVQMVDVDLTEAASLRQQWRERASSLAAVTWTDLAVAALARALARHPEMNAAFDGDALVLFDEVNVGVAVDGVAGLTVPVVAGADRLSLAELSAAIAALADGDAGAPVASTATVSNLGALGIRAGTPVLNPPETVLLFVGAVEDRVVAVGGAPAVRTMATLSFAFDHRATSGAAAARFVATVRSLLERPTRNL
ncbi:MAG: catalytic domain of component of various dehydrogenase complexe [Acidimicrobiales bacterium]|jgi:pyruvate dehydrogenase E2 component (dihydrolipoamide acetyltransferase)|nr:catalytic domain of component of various dehydrogenase complexe [Acidimicrobiales bacterium]